MNTDKTLFTHDAATAVFKDDADGITVDDNGDRSIDWSEVERVRIDDVPWADAFETTEFYKLPATVARPIPQQYRFGEDRLTLKKPRQELKKAAWSLHNAPWTLGHPNSRMVRQTGDIKGFWRDPRYIDSMDNLDADLYVPVGDEESKAFLENNTDVSVGFYNKVTAVDSYDGVVGGTDDAQPVDGYQTDMYFDHVASVPVGRCSGSEGCGIQDAPSGEGKITDAFKVSDSRVLMGDANGGGLLIEDQVSDGRSVVVADAYIEGTDFEIDIHTDTEPEIHARSGRIPAGTNVSNLEIEFETRITEDHNIEAHIHEWDHDRGQQGEYVTDPDGNDIEDSARITVDPEQYREMQDAEHEEEREYNTNPETAHVFVPEQSGDGNHVVVAEAKHETMDFWTCVHLEGDEYEQPDGPNISSAIGEIGPWPAGTAPPHAIMLEEELQHGQEFYVTLHADDDGEKGEHIRDAAENFIFDTGEFHAIGTNAEQEEEPVNPEEGEGEYDHAPFVDAWPDEDETYYETKSGGFISDTVITYDYRDEDGTYYAVAPDENPDGVPKYPITSCSGEDSVDSAWRLRNHGDIDISVSTLEERIQRRASALDCDSVPWETNDGNENNDSINIMTEETGDCGGLGLADLSVDAVAAKHEGVQAEIDAKDEKISELETKLEEAQDKADEVEDLQEKVDAYEAEEKQEIVDTITSLTDRWDEDDLLDEDLDDLEEKKDLVTELSADEQPANGGGDETPSVRGPKRATPWD